VLLEIGAGLSGASYNIMKRIKSKMIFWPIDDAVHYPVYNVCFAATTPPVRGTVRFMIDSVDSGVNEAVNALVNDTVHAIRETTVFILDR